MNKEKYYEAIMKSMKDAINNKTNRIEYVSGVQTYYCFDKHNDEIFELRPELKFRIMTENGLVAIDITPEQRETITDMMDKKIVSIEQEVADKDLVTALRSLKQRA